MYIYNTLIVTLKIVTLKIVTMKTISFFKYYVLLVVSFTLKVVDFIRFYALAIFAYICVSLVAAFFVYWVYFCYVNFDKLQ